MLSEEFEFLLSQYADGSLPEAKRAAVEELVDANPEARAELEKYRRLDAVIRASTEPMPAVRWDRLAEHLSDAVADHSRATRPISIIWARRTTAWAAAALVFLAVGIFTWQFTHQLPKTNIALVPVPSSPTVIDIAGPTAEPPAGPSVLQVAVGRPPGLDPSQYADDGGLVVQRPRISLAAAGPLTGGPIH